ncbi:MAG: hypothetical protein ACFE8V_10005 [Promethearchaeota archaeon]
MTIRFVYFQYLDFHIFISIVIPIIISAIFAVAIAIFMFRSYKSRHEQTPNSKLLKSAGILIIIFNILPLTFPGIYGASMTEFETFIFVSYIIFLGLLSSIPFFLAYGVFFFILGRKRDYNIFLMITGILWIISYGFKVVVLDGAILSVISILDSLTILQSRAFSIISFIFTIIRLNGFALLIIYGVNYNDKNLMVVGILGLVAFATNLFYRLTIVLLL